MRRSDSRRRRTAARAGWGQRLLRTGLVLGGTTLAARWLFLRLRRVMLQPTAFVTPPITPEQVRPRQRRIVLSDLHLGGGDHLDDFTDDEALVAFLDHYVAGEEPTELILAGDTAEFLQVRLPQIADDDYSDQAAQARMEAIIQAHPQVFQALGRLLTDGHHALTVLIGNHDFELHYPAAKAVFAAALSLPPNDERLRFAVSYHGGGIYLVHGNQFDSWNRFVYFEGVSEPFEVVRGTQLVKEVINELEEDPLPYAPLIDNVKPSSAFFWYLVALPRLRSAPSRRFLARGLTGLFQVMAWPTPHQMPITGTGPGGLLSSPYLNRLWAAVATFRRGRVARQREVARQVSLVAGAVEPPVEVIDQVQLEAMRQVEREQRSFRDRTARAMRQIALRSEYRNDRLFVCGHTHQACVLPLGAGRQYINTGTWTEIIYDVATMRRQEQRFPFLEISYPSDQHPYGRLLVWMGPHVAPRPWREEAAGGQAPAVVDRV